MKKSVIAMVVVVGLAGVLIFAMSNPGGISLFGMEVGGSDRAYIRERTIDFLEDLQFKDFDKASTYHLKETQEARDIPKLIRRAFGIKHEILDIQKYKVLDVDLDRSKTRGRVRTLVNFHTLGDKGSREAESSYRDTELIFYWFKQKDGSWVMELESSLRS